MDTAELARKVIEQAISKGLMIATAESCTGGMIAAALTDVSGSSAVFERGFVTYSNTAKSELLGIDPALIETHGAVSEPVACAMAEGALGAAPVPASVAVTGIAGPGGGSAEKPVGLVHVAVAIVQNGEIRLRHQKCLFADSHGAKDRFAIRMVTVETALSMLLEEIS